MRVKLVVTGDLERRTLGTSLERYFTESADGSKVEFLRPRKVHGITTNPLPAPGEEAIPRDVTALCRAMVAEAWEGSDGHPADLVVAIDDLELANLSRADLVAHWVRRGISQELDRRSTLLGSKSEQALRNRVRQQCSFHLLVPMVEAYFFGERRALQRAGVSSHHPPRLIGSNLEDFESNDPEFLQIARLENQRKHELGYYWWQHERHPKHYLEHLCGRTGGIYQETTAGSAALAELGWHSLPNDESALHFVRALFQDLSDFFEVDNPMGAGELADATYPPRTKDRSTLLLRNL